MRYNMVGARGKDPGIGLWFCSSEAIAKRFAAEMAEKFSCETGYAEVETVFFLDFGGCTLQNWTPVEIDCGIPFRFWPHHLYSVLHELNKGLSRSTPYVQLRGGVGIGLVMTRHEAGLLLVQIEDGLPHYREQERLNLQEWENAIRNLDGHPNIFAPKNLRTSRQ